MAIDVNIVSIGAGIAIGLAALGSAIGQGIAASAAAGATVEDEKLYVRELTFAVLPETQAIYGFIIAIMLIALAFGIITLEPFSSVVKSLTFWSIKLIVISSASSWVISFPPQPTRKKDITNIKMTIFSIFYPKPLILEVLLQADKQ